jgi:hypothetical protein
MHARGSSIAVSARARMYGNEGVRCGSNLACGEGGRREPLGGLGSTLGARSHRPV